MRKALFLNRHCTLLPSNMAAARRKYPENIPCAGPLLLGRRQRSESSRRPRRGHHFGVAKLYYKQIISSTQPATESQQQHTLSSKTKLTNTTTTRVLFRAPFTLVQCPCTNLKCHSSVSSGDPTHTYSDPTIERP